MTESLPERQAAALRRFLDLTGAGDHFNEAGGTDDASQGSAREIRQVRDIRDFVAGLRSTVQNCKTIRL